MYLKVFFEKRYLKERSILKGKVFFEKKYFLKKSILKGKTF